AAAIDTHPNGICYFNFLVGGLKGAQERKIPQATDYWGNSYWQGYDWLNEHAERNSTLVVPVFGKLAECAAPVKIREDINLFRTGQRMTTMPLYVMYITREEWYDLMVDDLESAGEPVHEIKVQGGVILRIHRIAEPGEASRLLDLWRRSRGDLALQRVLIWMEAHPELHPELLRIQQAIAAGEGASVKSELQKLMPPNVAGLYNEFFWYLEELYAK
ncbi:MAG: hypothetical protein KJ645_07795, partial [Planctomycetes bacterium]|nr:hypothetical protein [Planctomycetota bacterium]